MISVDVELALVGLVAMLEPATLISSVLALVLGDRPLRTGLLFCPGGIGLTLAIGVAAAFVLGNVAAAPRPGPKPWVIVFDFIAGISILASASTRACPSHLLLAPDWTRPKLAVVGGWVERHARAIAAVVMFALAISLLRDGIAAVVN